MAYSHNGMLPPTKMNELLIQTTAKMNFNIIVPSGRANINIENIKMNFKTIMLRSRKNISNT